MSQTPTTADAPPSYTITVAPSADGGDRIPDLSPREAFERWLNKLRVDKRESTVSAYHYQIKQFVEWCEAEGIVEIDDVTGWDLESYETYRRRQDVAAVTLNKELGTLKRFLEYCARIELVDESLPEKVDPPEVDKQADVDRTRLHAGRAEALFEYYETEAFGTRAHALLTLCWYTGARLNALRGLDLEHYHGEEQYVEFLHEPERDLPLKNGRDGERAVGFPEYVRDVVDEYVREHRKEKFADDGSRPLITSQSGRAGENSIRAWMYLATVPCLHTDCPHGNDPETCEYLDYTTASKCPSSRSPHQVRTGTITWQLNRGVPIEVVADRVNTSVRILKKHYDQPTRREELENRRREHVDSLSFDGEGGDDE
jgi:site-specific recombinase XerD